MTKGPFADLIELCQGERPEEGEIVPRAQYFRAMDCIIYLTEDCSYRARPIDDTLELLMHPQEERVVGIKLNGITALIGT